MMRLFKYDHQRSAPYNRLQLRILACLRPEMKWSELASSYYSGNKDELTCAGNKLASLLYSHAFRDVHKLSRTAGLDEQREALGRLYLAECERSRARVDAPALDPTHAVQQAESDVRRYLALRDATPAPSKRSGLGVVTNIQTSNLVGAAMVERVIETVEVLERRLDAILETQKAQAGLVIAMRREIEELKERGTIALPSAFTDAFARLEAINERNATKANATSRE